MKQLFSKRSFFIIATASSLFLVGYFVFTSESRNAPPPITASVETGSVRQLISVSGIAKATQRVELAFPTGGTVESVLVSKGQVVEAGQVLVTLQSNSEAADRQEAEAALEAAIADRNELIAGPTASDRLVTEETVAAKEAALKSTIETENRLVENAKRALYSTSLSAYSNTTDEDAIAPVVSGTYTCDQTGTYRLEIYSSNSPSGYSYRLSGIETGTFPASTDQALAIGNCGLRIRFNANSNYSRTVWFIDVPNQKSSDYTTVRNAYELAKTVADSKIAVAEQELLLARASASNTNAPARSEAIARANARVAEAEARLNRIDSVISNRSLVAPFSGTITEIDVLLGETIGSQTVLTLLAADAFEIIARVPEIDIGRLAIGQKVEMVFDAKSDEILGGEIKFISLQATEIDGVAYYEATIVPDRAPQWIRNGLNADINIIQKEEVSGLKIPKRFLIKTDEGFTVLKMSESGQTASTSVDLLLEGNDGFVSVSGLSVGDTIVAP